MESINFNWMGYNWITQERWGICHKDKPWAWYDSTCVDINSNNELELSIRHNPKKIEIDGKTYIPIYGMGLVSTTKNNELFKYGTYTWVAKMPRKENLWPALWMWSWDSWPPEIDVVEGWTNNCGGYFRFHYKWKLFQWNIQNNFHVKDETYNMAQCVPILKGCFKDPSKNFIEYKFVWTPDYIEFYYDNIKIRRYEDKNFMKYLNDNTKNGMNIIMNLHPTEQYIINQENPKLIIKSFNYKKL